MFCKKYKKRIAELEAQLQSNAAVVIGLQNESNDLRKILLGKNEEIFLLKKLNDGLNNESDRLTREILELINENSGLSEKLYNYKAMVRSDVKEKRKEVKSFKISLLTKIGRSERKVKHLAKYKGKNIEGKLKRWGVYQYYPENILTDSFDVRCDDGHILAINKKLLKIIPDADKNKKPKQ